MALAESRTQRTIALCALYVAQGVPWGFMLITLPAYLIDRYNAGDDDIGKLTAIILVPWSFKLIWAPLMDTFTIRSMGRRRPWIIGAELMMAVTLLGFIGLSDLSQHLRWILYMYFLHNCFASLQDVCTDALAVDILPPSEQGQMNGLMWGSKLVGKGVGAWGLSLVLGSWGLGGCVAVQVAILLAIMLIPMFMLERRGEKLFPWSPSRPDPVELPSAPGAQTGAQTVANPDELPSAPGAHTVANPEQSNPYAPPGVEFQPNSVPQGETASTEVCEANVRNPKEVFRDYIRAFSLTTTLVYIAFTLAKLIGVGINEVVTKTLFIQQLAPRWTDKEFSTAAGLYATGPIILAAILGGFLADRFGRRTVLLVGFGGYGLVAILFAALPAMWNERWFAMAYVLSCETLNAVGSVGFLSMAMRISWTKSAATVFTTYMTLSNVSHVVGNWAAGPVRSMLKFGDTTQAANMASYELTFWLVGLFTLVPLLLLFVVRPPEVDRARAAERGSAEPADEG